MSLEIYVYTNPELKDTLPLFYICEQKRSKWGTLNLFKWKRGKEKEDKWHTEKGNMMQKLIMDLQGKAMHFCFGSVSNEKLISSFVEEKYAEKVKLQYQFF